MEADRDRSFSLGNLSCLYSFFLYFSSLNVMMVWLFLVCSIPSSCWVNAFISEVFDLAGLCLAF